MIRLSLHRVLPLQCPRGMDAEARNFYGAALARRSGKTAELAGRGGCWFRDFSGCTVTLEIHVAVDSDFHPSTKAHRHGYSNRSRDLTS